MKKLVSFFAIALLAATAAKAQTSGAVQIGSMTVTVPVTATPTSGGSFYTVGQKSTISNEVFILRTSTGKIEYVMKSSGIRITNTDGSTADGVATDEIITSLAEAAVAQGYLYGYTGNGDNSKVWNENCIVRSGSGEYTRFAPCSSMTKTCFRDYEVTESPMTTEPTVTLDGFCPDCPGTTYMTTGTVQ